jgi:hypothetical protein
VAATDSAGNSLAAAVTHNFVVIRRVTVTVTSSAGLDGYVRQDLTYNSTVDYLNVGDRSDGLAVYGFVSFDSSMVPAGATITGATLTVYQESVTNYPFGSTRLGSLEVERVAYGSSLSGSDFNVAASPSVAIVIGNDAQIEPKAAELVSIAGACAGAATCQFRLRFTRDTEAPSDGEFDYVTISSAESSVASRRPTLRLTWETP